MTSTLVLSILLALVHLLGDRLRFLGGTPRSRWLSLAGGISVAYVVVHLLPEIAEYSQHVTDATGLLSGVERHVWLLVLLGLVVFYGVERWSRSARRGGGSPDAGAATGFSFASYATYNAVIGYVLARREGAVVEVVLFAAAMGLHFLVNDYGLREHHADPYRRYGRWVVSAAVVAGAVLGAVTTVDEALLGVLIAFIGGGTILNVLKEELPEERESRFGAFLSGAVGYTALLLLA